MPDTATKYVIARRDVAVYSERFDTREDCERALRFFQMRWTGVRFDILEAKQISKGRWIIEDPMAPADQVYVRLG